jgi:hypothetical protein
MLPQAHSTSGAEARMFLDLFRRPEGPAPTGLERIRLDVLDRAVRRLEANFAVRAITERPVCAPPAATQGKGNFASQVVFIAVNIDDFDNPVGIVDPQRAIGADSNLNLRHETSGELTNSQAIAEEKKLPVPGY